MERRAFRRAEFATGSREEALDIVQEAMFKLAQRYAHRDADEWGPLFQRILQGKIRDWYRRSKVRRGIFTWIGAGRAADRDAAAGTVAALADRRQALPEQQLAEQRALAQLQRGFRRLPLRQQEALTLRLWEGLNVEQTANIMGCSAGSVKTHYARALKALRDAVGGEWP